MFVLQSKYSKLCVFVKAGNGPEISFFWISKYVNAGKLSNAFDCNVPVNPHRLRSICDNFVKLKNDGGADVIGVSYILNEVNSNKPNNAFGSKVVM
jgi:hypothetical protein